MKKDLREFYIYDENERVIGFNLQTLLDYYKKNRNLFGYIVLELNEDELLIYAPYPDECDEDYLVASFDKNGWLKIRSIDSKYNVFDIGGFDDSIETAQDVLQCIVSSIEEDIKEMAEFLNFLTDDFNDASTKLRDGEND